MFDRLGMAEATPGPLIQVVQFVGFMAAFRHPGRGASSSWHSADMAQRAEAWQDSPARIYQAVGHATRGD